MGGYTLSSGLGSPASASWVSGIQDLGDALERSASWGTELGKEEQGRNLEGQVENTSHREDETERVMEPWKDGAGKRDKEI